MTTPVELTFEKRLTDWAMLAAATIVLVAFRSHSVSAPMEADECNYAIIAGRLLAGDLLYVDVWDHQPPGVFAFWAAHLWLVNDPQFVFWSAACAAATATLWLLFAIAGRMGGRSAAWLAAGLFALSSSDPGVAGEGRNREVFMNLLAVAAVALLLIRTRPRANQDTSAEPGPSESRTAGVHPNRVPLVGACLCWIVVLLFLSTPLALIWVTAGAWYLLVAARGGQRWYPNDALLVTAAGLCLGLASTFKTVMAAPWLCLFIWLVVMAWRNRRRGDKRWWWYPVFFSIGPAAVWLLIGVYFAATDRWSPFMDAVFVYNISYSNLDAGWSERFVHSFSTWTNKRTNPVLWIAGLIGLIGLLCRLRTAATWAITAATLGAVVAACLPGKPWSHYFQLLTPWAVLSAALTCGWLAMIGRRRAYGLRPAAIYSVILMAAVLFYQVHYYLAVPPDQVAAIRYAGRDVWAMQHGWNVARVTDASDEIFVWGNDPGIYHYSERNSASRYTMVTALLGSGRGVSDRQNILMTELRTRRPRLILITARPFSALDAFVRAEYQAVGLDREPSPTNRIRMHVLCDPDRLIEPIQWSLDAPPR